MRPTRPRTAASRTVSSSDRSSSWSALSERPPECSSARMRARRTWRSCSAFSASVIAPIADDPDRFGAATDPKTALQEVAARRGAGAPVYTISASGPEHARSFTATVANRHRHSVSSVFDNQPDRCRPGISDRELSSISSVPARNGMNRLPNTP